MKRILAIILIMVLILSSMTQAFAARKVKPEPDPVTIVMDQGQTRQFSYSVSDKDNEGYTLNINSKSGNSILNKVEVQKRNTVSVTFDYVADNPGEDILKIEYVGGVSKTFEEAITVNIVETPVNTPPVAVEDILNVDFEGTNSIDVLLNDSDPDDDGLTIVSINGVETVSSTYSYTHDGVVEGPLSIPYVVTDGTDESTGTITVIIGEAPVNTPPVAVEDILNVDFEGTNSIDVLLNDSDPDGDGLTIVSIDGVETVSSTYSYTHDGVVEGPLSIPYVVTDGTDQSTGIITVNIGEAPVNTPPAAYPDEASGDQLVELAIDVLANDTSENPLTIISVDSENASIDSINNKIIYSSKYVGEETFSYTVSDGYTEVSSTVTVMITHVSDLEFNYLGLGDSIPFGTYYTSQANYLDGGTDTDSYVEQIARDYNILAVDADRSVSGDNSIDLLNDIKDSLAESVIYADVITIYIGANDIMDAVERDTNFFRYLTGTLQGLLKYNIDWEAANTGRQNFETNWELIIDEIYKLNPDAKVIAATIYNPYHDDETIYDQVDAYFTGANGLNTIINDPMNFYNKTYPDSFVYQVADVYSAFKSYSDMDSLTGFYNNFCDPHPNQTGQNLIYTTHKKILDSM